MARCSTPWPKRLSGHAVEGGCGQNVGYARCYPTPNLVPRVLSLRPTKWPTAGQFFLKRWLSITENVRKQRASSICHIYHSLPSHKFSKQTRGRSESEKLECRINRSFGQLSYERAIIVSTSQVVNLSALSPFRADWVTVLVTCFNPCFLALTVEFSDARYVKYILITNFTVINIIYCNAEGLHRDFQTSTVKQHQIGGPARQERVT